MRGNANFAAAVKRSELIKYKGMMQKQKLGMEITPPSEITRTKKTVIYSA